MWGKAEGRDYWLSTRDQGTVFSLCVDAARGNCSISCKPPFSHCLLTTYKKCVLQEHTFYLQDRKESGRWSLSCFQTSKNIHLLQLQPLPSGLENRVTCELNMGF